MGLVCTLLLKFPKGPIVRKDQENWLHDNEIDLMLARPRNNKTHIFPYRDREIFYKTCFYIYEYVSIQIRFDTKRAWKYVFINVNLGCLTLKVFMQNYPRTNLFVMRIFDISIQNWGNYYSWKYFFLNANSYVNL